MSPIRFKPTVFKVTENARMSLKKLHDDENTALAIAALMQSVKTPPASQTTSKNFIKRFFNKFRSSSELRVYLDKEAQGDFFVTSQRKVNNLNFYGEKVYVDFKKLAKNYKAAESAVITSKKGILNNIAYFNQNKNLFKF